MRHPEGPRFDRRLKVRQEERKHAESMAKIPKPRSTVPNPADRHKEDRRPAAMTPDEVADWLKRNGINGSDGRRSNRRR